MSYDDRNSGNDDYLNDYDISEDYSYDEYDNGYDDYFGQLMRSRRNAARMRSTQEKVLNRSQRSYRQSQNMPRRRNDDIDSHYTPRTRSPRARQGSASGVYKHSQPRTRQSVPASAVRSSKGRASGARRYAPTSAQKSSTVVVSAFCLVVVVCVLVSMFVNNLYTSSIFSDDGAKDNDDTVIQERLITSQENKDKMTYFLIVGVDKSTKLTDCIWILCFDNEAHEMNVMQIPRDTYVGDASAFPHKVNAVYNNPQTVNWCETCDCAVKNSDMTDRIHNACGNKVGQKTESNISALIRFINNYLGLPIDHYVLFDFDGFEKVVDAMGGVDITLDEELKVYPNKNEYVTLPAGENHLDGEMALKFMRNRQAYTDGDLGRVKAQRKIIHAMLEKVTDMSVIDILSVLTAAYGNFSTDMSIEDIRSFISPVKKCGTDSLNMFEMPGYSHWGIPHSTHQSYYVCHEELTLEAINTYLMPYGDKLTAEDINFPVPVD